MPSKFSLENSKGIDHSDDFGLDGRIILKWTKGKLVVVGCGLDSSGSG